MLSIAASTASRIMLRVRPVATPLMSQAARSFSGLNTVLGKVTPHHPLVSLSAQRQLGLPSSSQCHMAVSTQSSKQTVRDRLRSEDLGRIKVLDSTQELSPKEKKVLASFAKTESPDSFDINTGSTKASTRGKAYIATVAGTTASIANTRYKYEMLSPNAQEYSELPKPVRKVIDSLLEKSGLLDGNKDAILKGDILLVTFKNTKVDSAGPINYAQRQRAATKETVRVPLSISGTVRATKTFYELFSSRDAARPLKSVDATKESVVNREPCSQGFSIQGKGEMQAIEIRLVPPVSVEY